MHLEKKGFNILTVVERKKPSPIDFRHLETFCRVASLKSFSKAAEDLFLTQPTISGHILSLEQSLSLRLFDRTSKEVHLTKAGEVLLKYASRLLSSRKDLLNALSEFSEGIRGELFLGASTIPGEYILPGLISDFKKDHPRLILSLKIADTKEIVQDVLQDGVEFGLIGAKLDHPSLHFEKYETDEIVVAAPSDYQLARQNRVNVEELLSKPWIIREEGSGTQMAVEKALRKKGTSLKQFNVVMKMGSTASVKQGVKAKLGLAFISERAIEEELSRGILSRVRVEGIDSMSRQIYIVFHRGRTLSPVGTEFLRFLRSRKGKN